jgi:hypothetical protein
MSSGAWQRVETGGVPNAVSARTRMDEVAKNRSPTRAWLIDRATRGMALRGDEDSGGFVAKSSEQFSWKLFGSPPKEERVCAECGKELRVVDVGRYHTEDAVVYQFYCNEHRRAA